MVLAFAAMVLPFRVDGRDHRRLGLGDLPAAPIVEYLARSASLLYGFHGSILLYLSLDPRRHAPAHPLHGPPRHGLTTALTLIDIEAGMPAYWTIGEGASVILFAILLIALARPLACGQAEP